MSLAQRIFAPTWGPRGMIGSWGGGSTYAGETINAASSLALVPVYNAVTQIAGGIAMLPLPVYERDGRFQTPLEDDHAWHLLNVKPNPEMAADELWEIVASHVELWGNSFTWMRPHPEFPAVTGQLWPLAPERVSVTREPDGSRAFWIEGERFGEDTILHIRNLSLDGLVGYSPIQLARQQLAIARAQEKFQGKFLKGDGKPSVILKHPNTLKPDAEKRLLESFNAAKTGGTITLEENIAVEKWTMPLADAQFLEQVEYSDKRIAQMFNLDPGRLGAKAGGSMTYKNAESEGRRLATFTLGRRMRRIEGSINRTRSIITSPDRFCKFDADALARAETKERYQAYMIGTKGGWLDDEDIRAKEGLPRRTSAPVPTPDPEPEGGDE